VADLPEYVFEGTREKKEARLPLADLDELGLRDHVVKYERALIDEALRRAGGNRRAAAKLLRIPVRTLFRKMRVPGATEEPET
jgi:transcriptional regulator with PAS, ATPase and Fis domain